jgi:hypothetical protein
LSAASACAEEWAHCCGAFVVLGVIAEIVLAIYHPEYDSFWEQWGSALSGILIAVGVAGEILLAARQSACQSELARRSSDRVARLTEELAEANRLADEAWTAADKASERAWAAEALTKDSLGIAWREQDLR